MATEREILLAEEKLFQQIKDVNLQNSLNYIKESAGKIWSTDAPRIIQDFTDHGIWHSKRLEYYISKLLEANEGQSLSELELYLLLSSAYLHDIGMQCDLIKFPEIKERAEKFGAKFDVDFSAERSNTYSIPEQKDIRKNHQYLSAAWIDYAFRTGNTSLGSSIKTVPEDLVADLIDICKYHSKIPINECAITFRFNPIGRKQFVAAILRFSDELDIDANRVKIETVKDFRLDPANSIYWWLHNLTKVNFISSNAIAVNVRLHPEDSRNYSSLVRDTFINAFITKNKPVLEVLRQCLMPLSISAESAVMEDDYAERLPQEIIEEFEINRQASSQASRLADEVRTWLQAIGYEVSDPMRRKDHAIEMLAVLDRGTVKQRVLVRCINGEILPKEVTSLDKILDRNTPQAWLISDRRVSRKARELAAETDSISVYNLSEFLGQKIWRSYFDFLKSLVKKDKIPDLYVDLACYKLIDSEKQEAIKDIHSSLDSYIDDWQIERGDRNHISLLGDFGAGKTWFCRHYAYRQLLRYLDDPINERLPLLITLRTFSKAMDSKQLINNALLEEYKVQFVGSAYYIFQEMNRRGKLLLILDGFDEMARQVEYQTIVDNFWDLAELVEENSKVILTCRTEYFHWAKESEKILGGEEYGRSTITLSPPKFEVLYLEPLKDDQIKKIIESRIGSKEGAIVADRIFRIKNLAEMARKPVLIELLLAAMDEVNPNILENQAQVYLYSTNKLLLRNIRTQRTFTTTADKLYFLAELAWEMIKKGELRIHYESIPDRIIQYFGDNIKKENKLDHWDYDLRNQTLLHRDAAGYYEFAHKSLAEYFVALKFAAELGCISPIFLNNYSEKDGQPCKIPFEQQNILELAKTFGFFALTHESMTTVIKFLNEILLEEPSERLFHILNCTKGMKPNEVGYVGGNIASLLSIGGVSFEDKDLANAMLIGANLCGCNLIGANLKYCDLNDADLRCALLSSKNIKFAKLNKTKITIISLNYAMIKPTKTIMDNFISKHSPLRDYSPESRYISVLSNATIRIFDKGIHILFDEKSSGYIKSFYFNSSKKIQKSNDEIELYITEILVNHYLPWDNLINKIKEQYLSDYSIIIYANEIVNMLDVLNIELSAFDFSKVISYMYSGVYRKEILSYLNPSKAAFSRELDWRVQSYGVAPKD